MTAPRNVTGATFAAATFLATILAANYVTSRYGSVPVGFGLVATAGTYLAGLSFVLRDTLHDLAGRWATLGVIAAGAVLSFAVSDPGIALASAAAFGLAESADLIVYAPLRRRGYVRAAIASNIVGAIVDTFVFLWLAQDALSRFVPGFTVAGAAPGQLVGKLTVTAVAVGVVLMTVRARRAAAA